MNTAEENSFAFRVIVLRFASSATAPDALTLTILPLLPLQAKDAVTSPAAFSNTDVASLQHNAGLEV